MDWSLVLGALLTLVGTSVAALIDELRTTRKEMRDDERSVVAVANAQIEQQQRDTVEVRKQLLERKVQQYSDFNVAIARQVRCISSAIYNTYVTKNNVSALKMLSEASDAGGEVVNEVYKLPILADLQVADSAEKIFNHANVLIVSLTAATIPSSSTDAGRQLKEKIYTDLSELQFQYRALMDYMQQDLGLPPHAANAAKTIYQRPATQAPDAA